MLDITSPELRSKAKFCFYYPIIHTVNGILHHTMLPEVGVMLVKAVLWSLVLMLSWAMPEPHSLKHLKKYQGYSESHAVYGSDAA